MRIKSLILALFATLVCGADLLAQTSNITPAPYCVRDGSQMPICQSIEPGEFDFSRKLKLFIDSSVAAEDRVRLIAAAEATGLNFKVAKRYPKKCCIRLFLKPSTSEKLDEGYSISTLTASALKELSPFILQRLRE